MAKKRPGQTSWESDEENLLMNDGGISAFRAEDDEIDEEALLGFDNDGADFLCAEDQDMQKEIFDIGVEVTEIDDLTEEVEADMLVEQGPTSLREELEQLDYVDDLPQLEEVRLEYDEAVLVEPDMQTQEELSQPIILDEGSSIMCSDGVVDGGGGGGGEKQSDSDSNDSDGFSKQERLRFKNERSGIINLSRVITRPGIPDTLAELSKGTQARGANQSRIGGGDGDAGRDGVTDTAVVAKPQSAPALIGGFQNKRRDGFPGRHGVSGALCAGLTQLASCRPRMQCFIARPSSGPIQRQNKPIGGPVEVPQSFRAVATKIMASPPFTASRVGSFQFRNRPPVIFPRQQKPDLFNDGIRMHSRLPFQLNSAASPMLRMGMPVQTAPARPHMIHVNPNFRGMCDMKKPTISGSVPSIPPRQIGPPPHMHFPMSHQGVMNPQLRGSPCMLLPQQAPLLQQQPNKVSQMVQRQSTPVLHMQQFPSQGELRFSIPQNHPQFPQSGPHHLLGTNQKPVLQNRSPFLPQSGGQGLKRGCKPFSKSILQRLGRQQPCSTPRSTSSVTVARKLTQQAKMMKEASAQSRAPGSQKNNTVVTVKRQFSKSNDTSGSCVSPKVSKTTCQDVPQEQVDVELQQGLEQQRKLREAIKKRKEEARCRQAAQRRKELEQKLALQGKRIEDIEKNENGLKQALNAGASNALHQGQRISTVISHGGKKQLSTSLAQQQCPQQMKKQPICDIRANRPQFHDQQHRSSNSDAGVFCTLPNSQPVQSAFSVEDMFQQQQQFLSPQFSTTVQQSPSQFLLQSVQQSARFPSPAQLHIKQQQQQPVSISPCFPPQIASLMSNRTVLGMHHQHDVGVFPSFSADNFLSGCPDVSGQNILGASFNAQPAGMVQAQITGIVDEMCDRAVGSDRIIGSGDALVSSTKRLAGGSNDTSQAPPQSNRIVLARGTGRAVIDRLAASQQRALNRQVVLGTRSSTKKVSSSQRVIIDNLAKGTSETDVRLFCEAYGPVLDLLLIKNMGKAIVTFANNVHANNFVFH